MATKKQVDKTSKQRVLHYRESFSPYDLDGKTISELIMFFNDIQQRIEADMQGKFKNTDLEMKFVFDQYYDEVEVAIECYRWETDDEHLKRVEKQRARSERAKKAAAARRHIIQKQQASQHAKDLELYLALKAKFEPQSGGN